MATSNCRLSRQATAQALPVALPKRKVVEQFGGLTKLFEELSTRNQHSQPTHTILSGVGRRRLRTGRDLAYQADGSRRRPPDGPQGGSLDSNLLGWLLLKQHAMVIGI